MQTIAQTKLINYELTNFFWILYNRLQYVLNSLQYVFFN